MNKWRSLEVYFGFKDQTSPTKNFKKKKAIEKNIIKWVSSNNEMVIAGPQKLNSFLNQS
jgi:hypothetical protein